MTDEPHAGTGVPVLEVKGTAQGLRRPGRRGRDFLRGPRRGDLRLPGPERGRQDHRHLHDLRAAHPDRRRDLRRRSAGARRPARGEAPARRGAAGDRPVRGAVGPREPRILGRHLRPARRRPAGADRQGARSGRAGRAGARTDQELLRRHEASAEPGDGPDPRSAADPARRADRGHRSPGASQHPRGGARRGARRADGPLHDALSGGGRVALRPAGDHRSRTHPRPGHGDRTQGAARRGESADAPGRLHRGRAGRGRGENRRPLRRSRSATAGRCCSWPAPAPESATRWNRSTARICTSRGSRSRNPASRTCSSS